MNKKVVIRFLLKMGHMVEAVMDADDATGLITRWIKRSGETHFSGFDVMQQRDWAVAVSEIQGIITYPPELLQQQQRQQPTPRNPHQGFRLHNSGN